MIVLIDNYDSFSYNLYQMLGCLDPDITVFRNDELSVEEVLKKAPDHLILSPGPGYPAKAGICEKLVKTIAEANIRIPVLGVCLGHQAICEALGGRIQKAARLMHGKQCRIRLDHRDPLFEGLEGSCPVGRYHSLAADEASLPADLLISAKAEDGEIMAVRHRTLPIHGVQFHPESILTPDGAAMLENFLKL